MAFPNKFSLASPSPPLLSPGAFYNTSVTGFQLSRIRCRVHPSVIMAMLDAHSRLSESNRFAIGTLLGTVSVDGNTRGQSGVIVEIVDCFANPLHWDTTTTALTIQKEPHEWMLRLREKINSKLTVVGWCCTTNDFQITTALSDWTQSEQKISRFQPTKTLPEPIHLVIDPTFEHQADIMSGTKAYVRGPLRELFHEILLQIAINPADIPGIAGIIKASLPLEDGSVLPISNKSQTSLLASLKNLQSLVDHSLRYVQNVLDGNIEGDPDIGRKLMQAVSSETLLAKEEVQSMLEGSVEDNLMIAYLTNLARLQFIISERLDTSFT